MPENVQHSFKSTNLLLFPLAIVIKVCTLTPTFCTNFTARIASGEKELSHYNNSEQCPSRFLDWMGIPEFSFSALSFAKKFHGARISLHCKAPIFSHDTYYPKHSTMGPNYFSYFSLLFLTCCGRFLHTYFFLLHTPFLMKVCGKLIFLTEKSITCEENYFSTHLLRQFLVSYTKKNK